MSEKLQVTIDDEGQIKLDLAEWVRRLSDEEKQALLPVWQDLAYDQMQEMLAHSWASEGYNSIVHRLRQAFFLDAAAPEAFRQVVCSLLHQTDCAKTKAEQMNDAYWKLWHAWPEDRWVRRPRPPGYMPTPMPSNEEIEAAIEAQTTPAHGEGE